MSTENGPHEQYGPIPQYGASPETSAGPAYGANPQYGSSAQYGTPPPPPPPPPPAWPGWQDPGAGYGQYPGGQLRKPRRKAMVLASGISAAALLVGGAGWALASASGNSTLSTAEISSQVDPGLVDVISTLGYQHATAEGTGMVLTPGGEVLTNNHVVAGSTSVKVRDIGNGKTYTAKVVGYSDSDDVAVLQLSGAAGLATVTTGNSGSVTVGQAVTALGNAEGKDGTPSVATGKVTALGETITAEDDGDGALEHLSDMIQTDANIEPGDSGGPLVSSSGQIIGMDTAASTSNSTGYGTTADTTTTAFSIPINKALALASQITAGRSSATVHIGATPFLGVQVTSGQSQASGFGQDQAGVTIAGTVAGTAAASAGLAEGDTMISVGGHAVASPATLQQVIETYHPGDRVSVEWTDLYGQAHTATVTLTAGPTG
jgi:S1-C subfamily serine protease